ncbi:PtsGHI operon antiterminator [Paenibacillus jamilae]|uniref:PtsGHI operon antiterminator n=2 Tax=Paenibacillus TaxID=44249 RepID=E3E6D5_PAEPS|nr:MULTISPECIES: PRD domain-containing protein [Paenibacillus]MBU9705379.1 PRD domain-containing protein [Paenibacillus sp. AK121]MCV9948788.1 PRD domain-containing protein [Paenibacillus sp. BT-177]ADO58004.1 PtsGHI operon antiterminator [Paenibacillus polymyxa SC2]AJE52863.1 PtsGHI operon antiterminator [Paenibacillus polymyxa]AUO07669.1 PRD domain-containing protein [Paenibacillus sp. lzh-N1]
MSSLKVAKALNNNVIIGMHPEHDEVVVIGKGIGFNRKPGDLMPLDSVEKLFILKSHEEQEQYKRLLPELDEKLIEVIGEVLHLVQLQAKKPLNEHILIALTDHIAFSINRHKQGITIHNPFLYETREIYPQEYKMAEQAVALIKDKMDVDLGEDEIGFVALHIYSAMTNQHISEVRKDSRLIADMVQVVETTLDYRIPLQSLDYSRLLTHLRFAIERVRRGEIVQEIYRLDKLLNEEYPEMYMLAWKLTKIMEKRLRKPVYPAEVSYLTMHLQRLSQRKQGEQQTVIKPE